MSEVRDAELGRDRARTVGGRLEVHGGAIGALGDRPMEQALRDRHGEQAFDALSAGRLAEDRHLMWVASEACDLALDPLEGGHLVEQAAVGGAELG
jgi:hypothetical protein